MQLGTDPWAATGAVGPVAPATLNPAGSSNFEFTEPPPSPASKPCAAEQDVGHEDSTHVAKATRLMEPDS